MENESQQNQNQAKIPHQAIIEINVEIMPLLPDGRVSGRPVLKYSRLKTFHGNSLDDCDKQIERFLNEKYES